MAGYLITDTKKITSTRFIEMKQRGEKISMLTAYDYTTAGIIDQAGVDGILVGDSASNVMAGNSDTLPITIDEMIYHARSVAKAVKRALVICDMPFGSYQISREEGIKNAIRIIKETGVDALKIEGGAEFADTIKGIIHAGIPVMGHLGLTPQSIHKFGGYGLRAKTESEAKKLMDDALCLEQVGCFGITLEKVPAQLATQVTQAVNCATIGIGAGQMSRVYSAKIAGIKAQDEGLEVAGCVMASDAFFPFRDGIDAAAKVGIQCVIHPGGSMRDQEVIDAADEHNMVMVLTGMRHFRH